MFSLVILCWTVHKYMHMCVCVRVVRVLQYRFAIVTSSRATFISEDENYKVDIQSFIVRGQQQSTYICVHTSF